MPQGSTPRREDDQFLTIAFGGQEEFLAHSHHEIEMKRLTKSIASVDGSYSRAWYQLAVVASKEGRFENALSSGPGSAVTDRVGTARQGVQLVDLDRLDEADDVLQRSLELEPESERAQNELGYLGDLGSETIRGSSMHS